jgi:N-acetyl-alpha-D-muramate 1-phosphate uridylyltransferase
MIFAAGLGTRLGPLGKSTPKALIDVAGKTMLEHVARGLVDAGVDRIVINVHHQADQIERFTASHDLGAEVVLSFEPERPLETGGGLAHARECFRRDAPFFLHNVDVLTDAHLAEMYVAHTRSDALVILAVSERPTSRHLLFDEQGLYGRSDSRKDERLIVRPPRGVSRASAFAGIHVANPELLDRIAETGVFSILDVYLRLAAEGVRIAPWDIGDAQWLEVGTAERLEEARRRFADPASHQ